MIDKCLIFTFCMCFLGMGICMCFSDCSNHHEPKVRVKLQSYQPCYIRLDEEQFERLLEVMKNK